jgi:tRNA G18 (ribose-2'-O)-methylase SpoU
MQKTHYNTQNTKAPRNISLLIPHLTYAENIGGILRLADAMGVKTVYFGMEVQWESRKLRKTARSCSDYISIQTNIDPKEIIDSFLSNNNEVLALEITEKSFDIKKVIPSQSDLLLVVGDEKAGIEDDLLSIIDQHTHICMYGNNSSMNVVVATGMALFQLMSE